MAPVLMRCRQEQASGERPVVDVDPQDLNEIMSVMAAAEEKKLEAGQFRPHSFVWHAAAAAAATGSTSVGTPPPLIDPRPADPVIVSPPLLTPLVPLTPALSSINMQ